jgi:perosamine synthetase
MKNEFIPVNTPSLNGNELKYLTECINSGWISSEGPFVHKFEQKMAKEVNRNYGISVSNGTAALDIAVAALDIGEGDEVIMPTFTIISCAAAIVKSGAKPVLVDTVPKTLSMNLDQIKDKISSRTKAIMIVHIYGLPVDMNPILEIAKKNNLFIIEDAAEMHGQTYYGKPCGSFGDISTFSFYPNKHITTGEGGMILTDNEKLAERCRLLRNLSFQKQKRFVHDELGWNYRFTNLQAAIGLAQLEKLNEHVKRKREVGKLYNEVLSGIEGISLPLQRTQYAENIYWVYGIIITDEKLLGADYVMAKLNEKNIGTRPFFWPMHEQPVFKKMNFFNKERYPFAEMLARKGFYLPSGLGNTNEQIYRAATVLKDIIENKK